MLFGRTARPVLKQCVFEMQKMHHSHNVNFASTVVLSGLSTPYIMFQNSIEFSFSEMAHEVHVIVYALFSKQLALEKKKYLDEAKCNPWSKKILLTPWCKLQLFVQHHCSQFANKLWQNTNTSEKETKMSCNFFQRMPVSRNTVKLVDSNLEEDRKFVPIKWSSKQKN